MAAENPIQYYEDPAAHGNFQYQTLENMVNNFLNEYCGDEQMLSKVKRYNIISWMKKGLQEFTFDVAREVRSLELELGDTLDMVLPENYVNYVRISVLDERTGKLRPLSENNNLALTNAYLQDNKYRILFDDLGFPLEGDSATEIINDRMHLTNYPEIGCWRYEFDYGGWDQTNWQLDPQTNFNGTFKILKREGRIHFSSNIASRFVVLEYISDGLEYSNEADIKINKLAETALMNWAYWNLLDKKFNIQEYVIRRAKDNYFTSLRTAKIRLMNIKPQELMHTMRLSCRWIK